jgi:hypothetical protein
MLQENPWLLISAYAFICLLVAIECASRGWRVFNVILMSLLVSPVIGAILFSPYNKEAKKVNVTLNLEQETLEGQ